MSLVTLMANPLHKLLQNKTLAGLPRRAQWALVGLARDFWKDGGTKGPLLRRSRKATLKPHLPVSAASSGSESASILKIPPSGSAVWHAVPGEISEKMWGDGFVVPGGQSITDLLIKPLGLSKEMSVLDLSAGLGARMRRATEEFGVSITGLEPDAGIAERGMKMSIIAGKGKHDTITHYRPDDFVAGVTVTRDYDAIIARETFYRVKDKNKFFAALASCTKPQAQISYTDYIVNPEDREKPAVAAWMAYEANAEPLSLVATAEAWAKVGFRIRVDDDQTIFYRKEALFGLQRFAQFLASGVRPDPETREALLRRLDLWTKRLAALEQGMKFYRFYGTK